MKIKNLKLGATNSFPQGKIDDFDEGELRLAIVSDFQQAIVRIVFGKPIEWLGLPINEAKQFANLILEKANELEKRKT